MRFIVLLGGGGGGILINSQHPLPIPLNPKPTANSSTEDQQ